MRSAMRSRCWSSVSGMKFSMVTQLHFPNRAALDALFVLGALENGVDKNAGRMNLIWVELAEFDELFDFGDNVVGGSRHHWIKIARSLAIDEAAPAVAFPRLDKRKVAADGALHDVTAAPQLPGFVSRRPHPPPTPVRV